MRFDINIFEALGMRNLSGLVGEYFVKSVQRFSADALCLNLHQDCYPDLADEYAGTYGVLPDALYIQKWEKHYSACIDMEALR